MIQLSLFDSEIYSNPKCALSLLKQHFDLNSYISASWFSKFYKRFGRKRDYSLSAFLWAFIIQKAFSLPTTDLLITFLNLSSELREFCGFFKVPDKSKFSRFKSIFVSEIEDFFHLMVDLTEPLCRSIDKIASETLIIDTTGIEVYVTENNPKFFTATQKRMETFLKSRKEKVSPSDVLAATASQMPKQSSSNPDAKYQYINGHFTYALKGAIICNKLGLIRHLKFCDSFVSCSDDLLEDKYIYDSKIFLPTINDFFFRHRSYSYKYILGDAGFDTIDNNDKAFNDFGLIPLIPLNPRFTKADHPKPGIGDTCPKDPTLKLKVDSIIREKGRKPRKKLMCPKTKRTAKGYVCSCDHPCTTSKLGYSHNVSLEHNLRDNPIIPRYSEQWQNIAGSRHIVEQVISRLKLPLNLSHTYVRNTRTAKFEFFFAGSVQLIIAYVAYKSGLIDKIRCIKSFAA